MDRRQQKTRDAIFKAFGALLSAKSFSKITVQDIIDKTNIGRTTFYDHFETKDCLLKEMYNDLFSHIFSETPGAESTHDFSMKTGNPRALITHILYHLLDNERNILGIITHENGEMFLGVFRQYINELMAARMLSGMDLSDKNIPDDFLVNHISSSFAGMVRWWIKNNLEQPPEKMAEYFMSVIAPSIGN